MPLNESTGNMYEFITHTWNTIKGKCFHDCSYCYMKRFKNQKEIRFDEKELKTNLGSGNFIFVGSSNDLFADDILEHWENLTLEHCNRFDNKYFFQTKNTHRLYTLYLTGDLPAKSVICTTIETNRYYPEIMRNSPNILSRVFYFSRMKNLDKYVTIEPVLDFDIDALIMLIKECNPLQVNIGADSCGHNLPEPSKSKILALIDQLNKFTVVHTKSNLNRLIK